MLDWEQNYLQVTDDDIFTPSSDAIQHYQKQLSTFLAYKSAQSDIIDMGRLPEVYSTLGISDKQLKTNVKTIFKALGLQGRNKHNVPRGTVSNLLSLIYDPEAVFKSLSASDNPNAYIAVLNAKTEKDEQIIAILSPSRDGQGFTFIPSIYEKHNFERFIDKLHEEKKALYIKNEGSELWGQLQSLPRHNSEPYPVNILTKDDVVKRILTKKEKNMADEHEELKKQFEWEDNILEHRFKYPLLFKVEQLNSPPSTDVCISVFDDPEALEFDSPNLTFNVNGDIDKAKKLVETTINHFETKQDVWINEISDYLESQINQQQQQVPNLQKINEHINENSTVQADGSVRVTGLSKLNRKLNADKPFLGDILKFALTNDRLPTDAEIAQMSKQGETSARRVEQINSKENIMSDVNEEVEVGGRDLSQESFLNAAHQRKVIADAIKAGTCACMPGKDGYADTTPVVNLATGKYYHGSTLLFLKEHQKENGFPTAEYLTSNQIDKIKEKASDFLIRKGQKGVSIYVNEKVEGTENEFETKHIRMFNVAQTTKPAALKEFLKQEKIDFATSQYGSQYEMPAPRAREPGPEIVCSSTEPAKYLGEYLAAVSLGGKFKAAPEQSAEFAKKFEDTVYAKVLDKKTGEPMLSKTRGEPFTDPYSIFKVSKEASAYCKEIKPQFAAQNQNQPEHKQEQTQSRGRGM